MYRQITCTAPVLALTFALVSLVACDARTRAQGTVVDSNGNPVPGASVRLTRVSSGRAAEMSTPNDGAFLVELIHGPFAGRFDLLVSKSGFTTYRQEIQAKTSQSLRITLTRTETPGSTPSASIRHQENNSTAPPSSGVGVLELPDGARFKTALYELRVIGQVKTTRKLPYYVLSGRGCQECDASTSIYIHSPSDGPMKNEGEQRRFAYPGKETSYEDGSPLYEARMFFGDCISSRPNAVVWFERSLGDDKKWHDGVLLAEVKGDDLVVGELKGELPKVSEARDSVKNGRCQEVAGIDGPSEP
jgi:Carboxypeptidase regulatory-like domain